MINTSITRRYFPHKARNTHGFAFWPLLIHFRYTADVPKGHCTIWHLQICFFLAKNIRELFFCWIFTRKLLKKVQIQPEIRQTYHSYRSNLLQQVEIQSRKTLKERMRWSSSRKCMNLMALHVAWTFANSNSVQNTVPLFKLRYQALTSGESSSPLVQVFLTNSFLPANL